MKRFITISLLTLLALPALACAWMDTHNYYLFSVCGTTDFRDRVNAVTNDNWKAYLGSTDEYFRFDADEAIDKAQQMGDPLMASYIEHLQQYLDCADDVGFETWDYPTKMDLAERRRVLSSVRSYAMSQVRSRLRSQHALLYMRCNMLLGQHRQNVDFWEQTASQLIETVYKDMMRDIYAGALLHTGQPDQAGQIFAELGDWSSLMTQYFKRRSYEAIRQEYLRDANSAVLPFLLQDFVNNAQEAVDAASQGEGWYMEGKLFIRNIKQAEARQMMALCTQAVSEGKSRQPVLWQSAKAWLEYLFGNRRDAMIDISKTTRMEGDRRQQDNARVLRLFIATAMAPVSDRQDDFLAGEVAWLQQQGRTDQHYLNVLDRLVHQVLTAKYSEAGRPETAAALLRATHDDTFAEYVDTMRVDRLVRYIDYTRAAPKSALDRLLVPRQKADHTMLADLVGTKYMRLGQWATAQKWLQRVPADFYSDQGYAVYAAKRQWSVEPWMRRQFLKSGQEYSDQRHTFHTSPKTAFAAEMQRLEGELAVLTGTARQQRCYDLAVRYAQASYTGDCWFLMRDGWSVNDTVRVNELNLQAKALSLLRQAAQTTDRRLKERALFAMCYVYLYPEDQRWYDLDFDYETVSYNRHPVARTPQYRAFAALTDYERGENQRPGPDTYVTRCDEYRQFKKFYK